MAKKLTEEQKAIQEEIRRQQREQLKNSTSSAIVANNADILTATNPEMLNEAVVYGSKEKKEEETPAQASAAATAPSAAPAAPMTAEEIKNAQKEYLKNSTKTTLNTAEIGGPNDYVNKPTEVTNEVVVYGERPKKKEEAAPDGEETNAGAAANTPGAGAEGAEGVGVPGATQDDEKEKDPIRAMIGNAYDSEHTTFADYLDALAKEREQEEQEAEIRLKADTQAAKWTGATEMAAAIANLIGVGAGNAVSQQYKPVSQDWMAKAEANAKESRNRIRDVRKRQDEIRLQMQKLKADKDLALAKYDIEKQQRVIENALAAQKAALDAQFKAGQLSIDQYKAETQRLYNEARVRNDAAYNNARISRLNSQRKLDEARTENIKNGGTGNVSSSKGNGGSGYSNGSSKGSGTGLTSYK